MEISTWLKFSRENKPFKQTRREFPCASLRTKEKLGNATQLLNSTLSFTMNTDTYSRKKSLGQTVKKDKSRINQERRI